jgi:hypothetical protein
MTTAAITNTFVTATVAEASKVNQNFSDLLTFLNTTGVHVYQANTVGEDAISSALSAQLGVNDGSNVRRGSIANAAESTGVTSTSYVSLNTADKISSVVVPSNALVRVYYSALWRATGTSAEVHGYTALFVGGNQIKKGASGAAPTVMEGTLQGDTDAGSPTMASGDGMIGSIFGGNINASNTSTNDSSFVTTGMGLVAPFEVHRLAAGTYDFEVKYKAFSGHELFVKERLLMLEVISF